MAICISSRHHSCWEWTLWGQTKEYQSPDLQPYDSRSYISTDWYKQQACNAAH